MECKQWRQTRGTIFKQYSRQVCGVFYTYGVLKMSNKIHVTEYFEWLLQMMQRKSVQFVFSLSAQAKEEKVHLKRLCEIMEKI